ncbi:msh4 meiotic DNA crossover [Paramicrosporidium saccamoebae]|uniref:Msh4 meiotic DNA crossover n=1 Tax=Paramicrosporidium saccamoebae TaxID=1246581 RepID=A0A2H9TM23_9FUNG|nr:msh4 meiotic DNA crossover [Paramicrosporidium saccamoebae]
MPTLAKAQYKSPCRETAHDSKPRQNCPVLLGAKMSHFQSLEEMDLPSLQELFKKYINQAVRETSSTSDHQLCYLLNSGLAGMLDVARTALKETTNDIIEYATALSIPKSTNKIPTSLISVGSAGYTTVDLVGARLWRLILRLGRVIEELIDEIMTKVGSLFNLNEKLAELDLISSFCEYCTHHPCVIPIFAEDVSLQHAYHPVLLSTGQNMDPMSLRAPHDESFVVITGANMAQIGCHVPADRAQLRLYDRIFTRLGSDDDLESNASTFTVEMREASYIMSKVTERSLVLIDELGRGTSASCGLALTTAICEELIKSRLVDYLVTFPNVRQMAIEVDSVSGRRVTENLVNLRHSGLALLYELSFPETFIDFCKESLQKLEKEENPSVTSALAKKAAKRRSVLKTVLGEDGQCDDEKLQVCKGFVHVLQEQLDSNDS